MCLCSPPRASETEGARDQIASSLNQLGVLEHARGNYVAALDYHDRALVREAPRSAKRVRFTWSSHRVVASWRRCRRRRCARHDKVCAAQEARRAAVPLDELAVATSLGNRSTVRRALGRLEEAATERAAALKLRCGDALSVWMFACVDFSQVSCFNCV